MHVAQTLLLIAMAGPVEVSPMPVLILAREGPVFGQDWRLDEQGRWWVTPPEKSGGSEDIAVENPALLDVSPEASDADLQGRPTPSGLNVRLHLVRGEILIGTLREPEARGMIHLSSDAFGDQRLALDEIIAMEILDPSAGRVFAPSQVEPPFIRLKNGDVVPGAITSVSPAAVTIDSDFGEVETPLGRLAAVRLMDTPRVADARTAQQYDCTLADGQRWFVEKIEPTNDPRQVLLVASTGRIELPTTALRRVVFPGWHAGELIGLEPSEPDVEPYLDERVSVEIDDPGRRRPRLIGGMAFRGGMTMRPHAKVRFPLPPTTVFVTGWVGMDPLRGRTGNCAVRIAADPEPEAMLRELTLESGARRFALETTNAEAVMFVTDFGRHGELGDCVNFGGLTLIMPSPTGGDR